jgi:Flp pilus assembly protein TadD
MKIFGNSVIPLEAQFLFRRGMEMVRQQRDCYALVLFRQAVCVAPGFSKAYKELGNCLVRLGRQDEAATCFAKAARGIPGEFNEPGLAGEC